MSRLRDRVKARLRHYASGSEDDDDRAMNRQTSTGSNRSTPDLDRKNSLTGSWSSVHSEDVDGGQRGGATMAASSSASWTEAQKLIYEEQLESMQEQLESAMIEKVRLTEELQALKASTLAKQLEEERQRSLDLSVEVQSLRQKQHGGNSTDTSDVDSSWVPVNEQGQAMPSINQSHGLRQRNVPRTSDSDASRSDGDADDDSAEMPRMTRLRNYVVSKVCHVLADFTVDAGADEAEAEPEELTFSRLKSNWKRFLDSLKPVGGLLKAVDEILGWKQWPTSLACFLLYMYTVWLGLLVPTLLFMIVAYLSFTYLRETGVLLRFSAPSTAVSSPEAEESGSSGSRKYLQLITQVAQRVQNTSGHIGDNFEKLYNLLAWHHPEATKKLYFAVWTLFLVSCVLPEATLFRLVALLIGYKMFIERSVYARFPKVKAKYDNTAKIWEQLPTNAQLEAFTELRARRMNSGASSVAGDADSTDGYDDIVSVADQQFCERFSLSLDQKPLPYFQGGIHSRLIDRDRPLTSLAMPGKLYVTAGYLCFERSGSRLKRESHGQHVNTENDMKHALSNIVDIKKAKAFQRLPGHGMAIEVQVVGAEKPLVFGAILNRGEVLQGIMDAGRHAGQRWGYPPDARPSVAPV